MLFGPIMVVCSHQVAHRVPRITGRRSMFYARHTNAHVGGTPARFLQPTAAPCELPLRCASRRVALNHQASSSGPPTSWSATNERRHRTSDSLKSLDLEDTAKLQTLEDLETLTGKVDEAS